MNQITTTTKPDFKTMLYLEDSEGNWLPPAVITPEQVSQARAILADMDRKATFAPADRSRIEEWLVNLGVLVAGAMPADEAKVKVAAYALVLASPDGKPFEAGCFTDASLKRIYPKFIWGFPKAGEVYAELRAEQTRLWKGRARLQRMTAPPPKQEERTPPTPEQQERVAAAIREAGIAINVTA
jgi:hypothetical protein